MFEFYWAVIWYEFFVIKIIGIIKIITFLIQIINGRIGIYDDIQLASFTDMAGHMFIPDFN